MTISAYKAFFFGCVDTPLGTLHGACVKTADTTAVCALELRDDKSEKSTARIAAYVEKHNLEQRPISTDHAAFAHTVMPLVEFLSGNTAASIDTIPTVLLSGGAFYRRVWHALRTIAPGTVTTYKTLAVTCQNPKAVRAVGTACATNPIGVLIPCHRVLASGAVRVGRYAGGSIVKQRLLQLEWEQFGVGAMPAHIVAIHA